MPEFQDEFQMDGQKLKKLRTILFYPLFLWVLWVQLFHSDMHNVYSDYSWKGMINNML